MSAHTCICVHVSACVRTCAHACICVYACVHTCRPVYTCVGVFVCAPACVPVHCLCVYTYACVHFYVHTCVCVHVYTRVSVCACAHLNALACEPAPTGGGGSLGEQQIPALPGVWGQAVSGDCPGEDAALTAGTGPSFTHVPPAELRRARRSEGLGLRLKLCCHLDV